jgi:hypothetical protein
MSGVDGGERRTLSSSQTFFVKFIGPAVFAPVAAYLLLVTLRGAGPLHLVYPNPMTIPWLLLAGAFVYSLWWSFRLKRVAVDGNSIYVSNYSQEVQLPLSAIVDVRENRWLKLHPVTIELDRDTPWGATVQFMPKIRFFTFGWISHPVVAELREMGDYARAGRRASLGIDVRNGNGILERALTFNSVERE